MDVQTPAADAVQEKVMISSLPDRPMTRKERREWYRKNKKAVRLPPWRELQEMTANFK